MIDLLSTKHKTPTLDMHPLALSSLLLRLLEHLLDDLLLLNQESTDNAVLDTAGAAGTTVGTADVLLGARNLGVFAGAEGGDLRRKSWSVLLSLITCGRFAVLNPFIDSLVFFLLS